MAKREYFRRSYKLIGVVSPQPKQEDEKAPVGCEIHYQRIICKNGTTADSDVALEVNNAGKISSAGHILNLAIGEAQVYDGAEIVVQGNEVLRLQWVASAAGDVLEMTLEGYLWAKA